MSPFRGLSTTKIAKAVGCHPNTVRLYEAWGFIPPVDRSPKGYRLYTPVHLAQMRLARAAMNTPYPGKTIRRSLMSLVRLAATGDLPAAYAAAQTHQTVVDAEMARAETSAAVLERWARGEGALEPGYDRPLLISEAARELSVSADVLRGWEANGLVRAQRAKNSYRLYTATEMARLWIIRMLRAAGYSTNAVLRMLVRLDRGFRGDLRAALDTPPADDDIIYASDRWLTTLRGQQALALQLLAMLEERLATETV